MENQYDRFRAELDSSPVHGRSPLGYVEVRRDAKGEISVSIGPGAFRELTHRQLTDEVHGALAAAIADYSQTSERLFQRWGGTL
ncbi:YbaB/EbfC family nucleoid-associated protein [Plantactinospora sp. WMMC1484]|uniref:YbaB/EbfC family nucleoid-associated protein n=1 Tax=Plantactinospora sp. WMMC1484 TaxID=3404122 RepID=UPI003BF58F6C